MAPVTITLNERPLYDLDWLEDCYKKVKFPNPKCEEFLVEVRSKYKEVFQIVSFPTTVMTKSRAVLSGECCSKPKNIWRVG